MTKTEAQEIITNCVADFLANPYNLIGDIQDNEATNEEFVEAINLIDDWDVNISWTATAILGDTSTTV